MRDVERAIAEISDIRSQLAAGALFRGFGPAVIAASGVLALLAAFAQSLWPPALAGGPIAYLTCWVGVAVISSALIGAEMWRRTRRHHGGLADAMMMNVIELFFPAGLAGAGLMVIFLLVAPDLTWLLPGLWQVLVALALCAAAKSLPQPMLAVGAWYLLAGLTVVALAAAERSLSPWMMGVPFAVGQLATAAILKLSTEAYHDED